MSMKINHQLCSPETLKKEYPMADSLKALKEKRLNKPLHQNNRRII